MASRARGRPCKVPGQGSTSPTNRFEPPASSSLDALSEGQAALEASPEPPGPSIAKYTEEDLQRILKTVLEARAPAPAPIPEGPRERPLKARFPDIYRGHFATAGAKGPNRIPLAASFLRDRDNFRWR